MGKVEILLSVRAYRGGYAVLLCISKLLFFFDILDSHLESHHLTSGRLSAPIALGFGASIISNSNSALTTHLQIYLELHDDKIP